MSSSSPASAQVTSPAPSRPQHPPTPPPAHVHAPSPAPLFILNTPRHVGDDTASRTVMHIVNRIIDGGGEDGAAQAQSQMQMLKHAHTGSSNKRWQ
ncbi:hypothetical protein D9615_007912 [Tricholomella constricta]|uniref:Uncharacterized protein n=1 Tax=Tricholomella constricta TaxID=117010 RepID=A0A8H5H2X8_9AGAR|nr:hypothetical protein D9615_007912 [Tricholomella constricta]